jgi:hypothetical protein
MLKESTIMSLAHIPYQNGKEMRQIVDNRALLFIICYYFNIKSSLYLFHIPSRNCFNQNSSQLFSCIFILYYARDNLKMLM